MEARAAYLWLLIDRGTDPELRDALRRFARDAQGNPPLWAPYGAAAPLRLGDGRAALALSAQASGQNAAGQSALEAHLCGCAGAERPDRRRMASSQERLARTGATPARSNPRGAASHSRGRRSARPLRCPYNPVRQRRPLAWGADRDAACRRGPRHQCATRAVRTGRHRQAAAGYETSHQPRAARQQCDRTRGRDFVGTSRKTSRSSNAHGSKNSTSNAARARSTPKRNWPSTRATSTNCRACSTTCPI